VRPDTENRAFQLQRLEQEGKPLCEEIARTGEELNYNIEQEADRAGQLSQLRGVLRQATGQNNNNNKEKEPEPITRRQFILGSQEILQVWHEYILSAQLQILQIEKTLTSERENRQLGSRMEYFRGPDGSYTFRARDKEPLGFKPPKKIEDSATWRAKQEERKRKKKARKETQELNGTPVSR
jgi:hypothetical protein